MPLRDHYCALARQFVQSLAEEYEAFAGRSTAVAPVSPDTRGRASVWRRRYDPPFGLLTDPAVGDEDGFETFAPFQRLFPGLPEAVLFESQGDSLRFGRTVRCDGSGDCPGVDVILEAIDDYAAGSVVSPARLVPDVETVSDS